MSLKAPRKIPKYIEKFNYLTSRKDGRGMECPIAVSMGSKWVAPDCLHHAGIHNTIINRKKYPLVVHSLLNLIPVNNNFHLLRGSYGIMSDAWAEKWQRFLEKPIHAKCRRFVNLVRG